EQFRRSAESEPNLVACDRLGDIYTHWGQSDKGEEAFGRAVSLEPFDSHGHFGLAALYAASGRSSSAAREYKEGLQTDPGNREALAALRRLRRAGGGGKKRNALQSWRAGIAGAPPRQATNVGLPRPARCGAGPPAIGNGWATKHFPRTICPRVRIELPRGEHLARELHAELYVRGANKG